jgi:hypothetical protein
MEKDWRKSERVYAEIRQMQVSWVEGHVQAEKRDYEDECSCTFRLGNVSFSVPCRGCDALASGIRYRVYYLAAMNEFVSIEPLEDPLRL